MKRFCELNESGEIPIATGIILPKRKGGILGHLKAILGHLGALLGPYWAILGHLGTILRKRGVRLLGLVRAFAILAHFGTRNWHFFRNFWGHVLDHFLVTIWTILGAHFGIQFGTRSAQEGGKMSPRGQSRASRSEKEPFRKSGFRV